MPEVCLRVRWPDRSTSSVYSPSTVVKEYFEAGAVYALDDFVSRARHGLRAASERVRMKYGYACSRAEGELAEIEAAAARYASLGGAQVTVEALEEEREEKQEQRP
jgi:uncharacterized repeat protein (TIGR04042 family)